MPHRLFVLGIRQQHAAGVIHGDRDCVQGLTERRTDQAATTVDVELSAVSAADDTRPVGIEVFMLAPGQRRTLVRARVPVAFHFVATAHDKHRVTAFVEGIESSSRAILEFIEVAKIQDVRADRVGSAIRVAHRSESSCRAA
jgi:hypothetical protein